MQIYCQKMLKILQITVIQSQRSATEARLLLKRRQLVVGKCK